MSAAITDPFIQQVRRRIRYAENCNHPELLGFWFELEAISIEQNPEQRWQAYLDQARLLFETYADELIAPHWRQHCLNQLYIPLCNLQKTASNDIQQQQLKTFMYELHITEQYLSA